MASLMDEMEAIIAEEVEVMGGVIEALKKEREGIVAFHLKTITESAKSKQEHLMRIATLEAARNEILKKMQRPLKEELDHTARPQAERVRHRLSCLKSLAQAAQEFNEIQKNYIAHSLSDVQTSLTLLDSLQGGRSLLYDQKGFRNDGTPGLVTNSSV